MDTFIKKIFGGEAEIGKIGRKIDEFVHMQFQKFSKGIFKNRAVISAKKIKEKFTIGTTPEFANEFVRIAAEKLGAEKTLVIGAIVSTRNLKELPEFDKLLADAEIKQYMGIKQYQINREFSGNELILLLDKFPLVFFALTFNAPEIELKIKAKAPKNAKPSSKGEEKPKANFCKIATTDRKIAEKILFDIDLSSLKKAEICHDFVIEKLILPEGEKDFAKMRENAKRKGKIIRYIDIDGKQTKKETEFTA